MIKVNRLEINGCPPENCNVLCYSDKSHLQRVRLWLCRKLLELLLPRPDSWYKVSTKSS